MFYLQSTYNAPKTIISRFPRTSCSFPFPPYFPPLRLPVFGWLLCVKWSIGSRLWPRRIFSFIKFRRSIRWPNDGTASTPQVSPRSRFSSSATPTANANYDLIVFQPNGDHLMPKPCLSLSIFALINLRVKTRQQYPPVHSAPAEAPTPTIS